MTADVVIIGAGPNGLMLACELSLAGVRPLVLERLPARTGESRANGLVGQVVRMLDRRGLYERLAGEPGPPRPQPFFVFGALPLDLRAVATEDNPLYGLMVPQRRVEQVLEERAAELGVEIRRGHELTGLAQDGDGVTAEVTGPEGGYRLRARYLVGADGGRSVVRKLSGIGFPGVSRDDSVSRTMHVTVPAELVDPATGGLNVPGYGLIPPFMHHRTERGLFVFAPFPTGTMVSTAEREPAATGDGSGPTIDELRESVRRVLGADLPLAPPEGEGPHLRRRLTGGNTRLADRFRDRRVLLLGDAAHVHSAIGGPGLNLGLQDAVNLGWKLAAEVRGFAPPGLLDTYETERRPVARRVVMHTQAQSALTAPGPEVTALRELFAELLRDPANARHIAATMAGADVRYAMDGASPAGAGAASGDGAVPGGGAPGAGRPQAGAWAPDLSLVTEAGPVRLADLTTSARPLLLDLTEDGSWAAQATAWHDRVDIVHARLAGPVAGDAQEPVTGLLLRPDCYVAWATSAPAPSDLSGPGGAESAGLRAALSRWFGAARTEAASRA
ncbi:FAD-dependent oxidoreductase [Sphaerisporangium melleum]|uniref:FAD-dependent oxidoreductase n=1 Tax=Sphaerisporangium melleum TaxID=321316 RepID=A0A917VJQ1_9ACTN|nr:FAD-dependent monooxygenase [Sphaerisporangium melleum]GGK87561.1 FAD-dependent oxidoreductase [Sphaerisporangium melleum]GII72420.1 FAD-dependent oxidoreductase [Sphaerisporangium melleum]